MIRDHCCCATIRPSSGVKLRDVIRKRSVIDFSTEIGMRRAIFFYPGLGQFRNLRESPVLLFVIGVFVALFHSRLGHRVRQAGQRRDLVVGVWSEDSRRRGKIVRHRRRSRQWRRRLFHLGHHHRRIGWRRRWRSQFIARRRHWKSGRWNRPVAKRQIRHSCKNSDQLFVD